MIGVVLVDLPDDHYLIDCDKLSCPQFLYLLSLQLMKNAAEMEHDMHCKPQLTLSCAERIHFLHVNPNVMIYVVNVVTWEHLLLMLLKKWDVKSID